MLVSICGSQGSGKSTTLNELKRLGYNIVERKTSRSILSDWNVSLEEVNNDMDLTFAFQEEITKRKCEDEKHLAHSKELWFTERTHTDLFVYTLASIGKYNHASNWLDDYFTLCKKNNNVYFMTFMLPSGQFNMEYDGTRGVNQHYVRNIDLLMNEYQPRMLDCMIHKVRQQTPQDRAKEIIEAVESELCWAQAYNKLQ